MKHYDKFPPNAFLKKHMTPGRTILAVLGFIALELVGAKYFPHQLSVGATYFLMVWVPFGISLIVWHIVWTIRNPAPPRKNCPHCHQFMPEDE